MKKLTVPSPQEVKTNKLASHNTMSYLTPAKWYMRLFRFVAKCQDYSIQNQYHLFGIRVFDLRIKFDENNVPHFAHGAIIYKGYSVEDVLLQIDYWRDCSVRLIFETRKDNKFQNELFALYAQKWVSKYKNIKFFGCNRKFDWYSFPIEGLVEIPKHVQKVSSMTGSKLDDWWPRLYAYFNNKKNVAQVKDSDDYYTFIDFIGKYY